MKNNFKRILALFMMVVMLISVVSCNAAKGDAAFPNYAGAPKYNSDAYDSDEDYTEITENPFISTLEQPDSYFSIDANTASYPNLRRYITNGNIAIPKDAVRVEEMLNYFNYDYETPTDDSVFALTSSVFDTPYNESTKLLTIGLAAEEIEFQNVQNNLVFLIDVSGSMYSDDKLPLVQQSFLLLLENLNPTDRVSIVTYAGSDQVLLKGAYGYEKQKIAAVIEDLSAGGSTAGSAGLSTAYDIAKECFVEGGNNRIILATDGDLNVGITSILGLESFVAKKAKSGIYLSVFGFGTGNIKSDKMESLALKGNGTYSYIDSVREARRALVEQIGGSMITVAKDVKAGIVFNPEYVESYRLIGYENKLLTQEEFEDSNTDAGEIGSGHTLTVCYELVLTDQEFVEGDSLAEVKIKYKPTENVGGDAESEVELILSVGTDSYHSSPMGDDAFIAAVVEFALILRNSEYKGNANLNSLIARLDNMDFSGDEYKEEFRNIVKIYSSILGSIEG